MRNCEHPIKEHPTNGNSSENHPVDIIEEAQQFHGAIEDAATHAADDNPEPIVKSWMRSSTLELSTAVARVYLTRWYIYKGGNPPGNTLIQDTLRVPIRYFAKSKDRYVFVLSVTAASPLV